MSIVLGDEKTGSEENRNNQIEEQIVRLAISHSGLALQKIQYPNK